MSNIKIIPAIDLIEGKCVRLSQGDYGKCSIYCSDPVDVAKGFQDAGAEILHLVDLDGAKTAGPQNLRILEKIASETSLDIEFGGGLKSEQSISDALNAGAFRVICGSIACKQPEIFALWLRKYSGGRVVLGADVKDGLVAVNGWTEKVDMDVNDLIAGFLPFGLKTVEVTDVSKDGMLSGPATELYSSLIKCFPGVTIVASGGVSSIKDVEALDVVNVRYVIVGKAFYEGRITLGQLEEFNL